MMARERNPESSKKDILAAAEMEFSAKGFYGARVDVIAETANINKRMIYAYFGDKEALYKYVLSNVYTRMEQVEQVLVEAGYSGKELVKRIIATYFDFLKENPTFVNLLMWENLNHGHYLNEIESSKIERSTISFFVDELRKGKESGEFRKDIDEWQTVVSLITTCFANFSNQYTLSKLFHKQLGDPKMIEQRKQHTTDMVLAYLCGK